MQAVLWRACLAASVIAASLAGGSDRAVAQVPPGAVVPPAGTPIPRLAPTAPPAVGPGAAPPPAPSAADPALATTVALRAVAVEGATAFQPERLAAVAAVPLGPAVPLREVERARAALLTLYRDAGYAFTAVDATVERDGLLRLAVAEGHVVEVRLDGDIGPAGTQVLRFLNNLTFVRPIDVATLERWLLLASDVPGVTLRAVLRPAGTAPGALSLVAQVARRPVSGFVTADNRAFRLTGREQLLATAQFNSFTELGERTEISFFWAARSTQLFGQASTELFLGGSGARLRLYAGAGESEPSGPLRAIGYAGQTQVAGVSVSYPLIRRRQQTLLLSAAFDLIESEIRVDRALEPDGVLSRDSLRVFRLGADWSVYDALFGDERPAVNALSLRFSQGLAGVLGASSNGGAELSRQGARTGFTKMAFDVTRTQTLFSPFRDATVLLQGTLAGQWTDDVLPQAEKFYLGGARLGRGYYAGEVTGDRALAGSVELQLALAYEAAVFGRSVGVNPVAYAFYDRGQTFEARGEDPDRRISSAGIGLRASLTEYADLQIEGVRRFTRRPSGQGTEELRRDALYWRVLVRF